MDDSTIYNNPTRRETHFGAQRPETHRCWYGNSNRCACGKHREPARATSIVVVGTDRERLALEI